MVKNINVIQDFRDLENTENADKTRHLFIEDNVLYSYGYHYPLCIKLKNESGYFSFFINSDGYSNTTARHTGDLIRTITRLNNFKELKEAKKKGEYNHIFLLSTEQLKNILNDIKYKLNKTISQATINDLSLLELEKEQEVLK